MAELPRERPGMPVPTLLSAMTGAVAVALAGAGALELGPQSSFHYAALAASLGLGLLCWQEHRKAMAAAAAQSTAEAERRLLLEGLEATPCHFAVFSADRVLLACNDSYRKLHAKAFEELTPPIRYDDLMRVAVPKHLSAEAQEAEVAARVAMHESGEQVTVDRYYPNGRWMRLSKRRLSGGEIASFGIDITEVKARETALASSEARYRALLGSAPVGIWHLDPQGNTVFANAWLARLFGGEVPASLRASGLRLAAPEDRDGPFGLPPGREVEASLPAQLQGAAARRVLVTTSPWLVEEDGREGCVLTVLDISPLKAAQARVEHLAGHDPLTGLANRTQFHAALAALVQDRRGGALITVDLDHFKNANDRHGHAAGDALLRVVAERLQASVRPGDLVCRLGGDEFAIIAFGATQVSAQPIAARLLTVLEPPVPFSGAELRITASLGVACTPLHAEQPDALLRAADLALLEAKRSGRAAAVMFEPEMRTATEAREKLREALAAALRERELHLVYQPQLEIGTRRLVGVEALIRWHSKELGRAISPAELLPAAAEAGLMPELDAFVLDTALQQMRSWAGRAEAPPRMAINVSVLSLQTLDFADKVARALLAYQIQPQMLEIEIPEDLAVRDLPGIEATLQKLHEIGVELALDDFGSGHSSLMHVVRLPVHRVKLDRSIVAGLPDQPKDVAVLRATMALARGMGIEVIGEGVETEGQAFALRRAGCQVIQGWLVGRPVPASVLVPEESGMVQAAVG